MIELIYAFLYVVVPTTFFPMIYDFFDDNQSIYLEQDRIVMLPAIFCTVFWPLVLVILIGYGLYRLGVMVWAELKACRRHPREAGRDEA